MYNFEVHTYLIECLSNLHVGSGDNNYGIIDKQVQRCPITHLPVIHASGLKGALREYFEQFFPPIAEPNDATKTISHPIIAHIFGTDKDEKAKMLQGKYRFFEAQLLCLPVRGTSIKPFYRATTQAMLNLLNKNENGLKISLNPNNQTDNNDTEFFTEKGKNAQEQATNHLGGDVVLLSDKEMKEVVSHLPVIARNKLENGQSENLWYEEVVPRESRFYFCLAVPKQDAHFQNDFDAKLNGKTVQIGANATVGYGYCKITKIS